jgi:hypothetical protein
MDAGLLTGTETDQGIDTLDRNAGTERIVLLAPLLRDPHTIILIFIKRRRRRSSSCLFKDFICVFQATRIAQSLVKSNESTPKTKAILNYEPYNFIF